MKVLSIWLLLYSTLNINAQMNKQAEYVKGKCFDGYIFPKEYVGIIPLDSVKEKYTPSKEDILNAENILEEQLAFLNKKLINQGNGCPIVHKKLKKYKRQYIGLINENGEKVVWINFIWAKKEGVLTKWDKEVIIVLDGCSYYWNVKVNLDKQKLFDLSVNGSA